MIEVYGRDNCSYCEKAINLLEIRKEPYKYYKIGRDLTLEELLEKFPGTKTVPVVVAHGFKIGGFTELESFINEKESLTSEEDY
jgi:glutaredoxin